MTGEYCAKAHVVINIFISVDVDHLCAICIPNHYWVWVVILETGWDSEREHLFGPRGCLLRTSGSLGIFLQLTPRDFPGSVCQVVVQRLIRC